MYALLQKHFIIGFNVIWCKEKNVCCITYLPDYKINTTAVNGSSVNKFRCQ